MSIIELPTLEKTSAFGRYLGEIALPGDVITLEGGLGAGKTTLTQAIARGLDIPASYYITSPTFSLVHEFPGRIPLYHIDLYRIGEAEEIEMLGLDDYLYGDGLTVVEWPERLGDLTPVERLNIKLLIISDSARNVCVTAHGVSWRKRSADIAKLYSKK